MATAKAISGNPQKNNGATVLRSNTTELNDVRFDGLGDGLNQLAPVSGLTQKAISAGTFAYENNVGLFLGYSDQVAGQSNDAIKLTGYQPNQDGFRGYQRIDIESINALTGVVTYGENNGVTVPASGLDGTTGVNADHNISVVPGELVYQKGSLVPVQADY